MVRRGVEAAKPEALIAEAQVECFHDREFPVSSSDTALVLIDMQTDFLSKDGRLGKNYSDKRVKQLAATEAKVAALLAAARRAGMTVAHSRSHRYGADVRRDLCVPTIDPTYDFVDSCKPRPGEIVVDKWTFGAFASTDLETQLRRAGIKRILLAGILTNVCIMATAVQAVDRFFRVCLVEDACGRV
jgi:nicotinamidase-related amidase